jgi:phosphoribosyl 1,2-cyclic phosphodiesterase
MATPRADSLRLGGNTSCYEVELGAGATLILDCGTGLIEYAASVMGEVVKAPRDFHIFVSHFHWDHILGFPFFHPIHVRGVKIHLYSAFEAAELEHHLRALFDGSYSPLKNLDNLAAEVSFHAIPGGGLDVLGAKLRCARTDHTDEGYALRVEHGGKSLCYVTDHEARGGLVGDGIVALMRGSDLVLHDAQYTAEEYAHHVGYGHSSIEAALTSVTGARAKRLLLTHHDPNHSDAFLDSYVTKLTLSEELPLTLAEEGVWVDVG